MQQHPVRMSDVAAEARVSITTVSTVLNRPDAVAAPTRLIVQEAIQRLDFKPNPHAVALRRKPQTDPSVPRRVPISTNRSVARTGESAAGQEPLAGRVQFRQCLTWKSFKVGERVEVIHNGKAAGTGTIDDVMADGTAVWLRLGNGGGRVILLADDGYDLVKVTENDGLLTQQLRLELVCGSPSHANVPAPIAEITPHKEED